MASSEQNRLNRLAGFADSLLLAANSPWSEGGETWFHGKQIEAFLWMDLGVKLGAFPEAPARFLAEQSAPDVATALRMLESGELGSLIPGHTRQMLRRTLMERSYFSREQMGYQAAPDFAGAFDGFLFKAIVALRDPRHEQLFNHVHAGDQARWTRLEFDSIEPEMIESLENGDPTVRVTTGARLTGLFTHCLDYWIETDRDLAMLAQGTDDASARIGLAGNLASLQSWRFGFSSGVVRQRMLLAARRSVRVIQDSSPQVDGRWENVETQLVEEMNDLMFRWEGRTEPNFRFA